MMTGILLIGWLVVIVASYKIAVGILAHTGEL